MTQQEIENNYTYKIVKRILLREYPWIKEVQLDAPRLTNFNYVIFLDLFIDPYELGEMHNWKVARWIDNSIERNEPYDSMSLSLFFEGSNEEMREEKNKVNTTMEEVQNSSAIPQDMRLTQGNFMVGSFITIHGLTIPQPNDIEDETLT